MNRLFVYGIFLDQSRRDSYGMFGAHYATVKGYATRGGSIVEAVPALGYTLTGMIVDVSDKVLEEQYESRGSWEVTGLEEVDTWKKLDELEHGYDRIEIVTTGGDKAFMYVAKERGQR